MKSLSLSKPHMLIVVGLPGAGKTFFARQFSDTFSAPFLELDYIEQHAMDATHARDTWRHVLDQLILTKQTLLVEGYSSTKNTRREFASFAREHGYQPLFIWVQTEVPTAKTRATKGVGKNKPTKLRSAEQFDTHVKQFEPLHISEPHVVISGKHTYATQAKNILKKLTETRRTDEQAPVVPSRSTTKSKSPGRITIQ